MTNFERALFEIAEELIRPYDLVPSYALDYAEMWREVEAYDIPEKRIPTEDELWKLREYEEWCKLYDSVDADILAYVESGLLEVDDVSTTGKNRKRAERRANNRKAKNRHREILLNYQFDPEYSKVRNGCRLSELYNRTPAWRKYWESPKIVRRNPNLSGKGSAYKKVRGWWD